ncbi:MAG TPA: sulfur carrier protein ThiS [Vulgatibacter sp.]|nr:sulfur carrier protein ThiS [Vulgatibacter sp.]
MILVVNGEERKVPAGSTVSELLDHLGVVRERVAVEVNLQVVRRADHDTHRLQAGDRVEVVAFVGGG